MGIVYGTQHMGDCDYFTYAEQEYFITAKMCHIWFVPLCPDPSECLLRSKSWQNRGIDARDVPGAVGRCYAWAIIRRLFLVLGIAVVAIGLATLGSSSLTSGWSALSFGTFTVLLSIYAYSKKPKAKEDTKQRCIQKLRGVIARAIVRQLIDRELLVSLNQSNQDTEPAAPARPIPMTTATIPLPFEDSGDIDENDGAGGVNENDIESGPKTSLEKEALVSDKAPLLP